jgi:Abnormal spindle-like microcephaly-assoc'd, ASPM-SPD-2-Hydin/Beta-propeller repeat
MQFMKRIPRLADSAARYLVVGALFAASVAVLLRAPSRNSIAPGVTSARSATSPTLTTAPPSSKLALDAAYGNLPLRFEANRGQADPRVRFLSRGSGSELFLADAEAVLVLTKPLSYDSEPAQDVLTTPSFLPKIAKNRTGVQSTALRFSLAGAHPSPQVTGIDRLPETSSYFIGNDPSRWVIAAPNFSRVAYRGIYSGVDLTYYGSGRDLEFDFDLAPHADPSQIRLKIEGANSLTASSDGDLVVATAAGEVRINRPEIYQLAGSRREKVDGSYVLASNNEITLQLGAYDTNRALIVDPVIQYSTFFGGTTADSATGIFVDTSGNAYITGVTSSTDFPVTAGVLQSNLRSSHSNAFISKLSANGSVLLYSTYLGGTGANGDGAAGIAADSQGDAFVTGFTASPDFPTVNAFQGTLKNAGTNAFVAELNPSATALLYSTYLGGSGLLGDFGQGIVVDSTGSAYVAGVTSSADFPLQGPIQGTLKSSGSTGFVTKFSATGSALVYSTYLGGSGSHDAALAIALDSSNDAFVAGTTNSTDFPTTTGAFQPALNGGGLNAFLSEINPGGSALSYSTFLGGSSMQGGVAAGLALDSTGAAYLTGGTTATDFPTTPGAAQTSAQGSDTHAFVSKINPAGQGPSDLVYSTYLSGSDGNDFGTGIAVDATGNANVTGGAASTDFPVTKGPIQPAPKSAGGNAFITRLNPAGSVFLYSSTFGGSNAKGDVGNDIALDSSGNAYVAGITFSSDFPTTSGSLLPNFRASNGNSNGFVTKLSANAVIGISPASLDFGSVLLNIASQPQLVTFTNNSTATLNFSAPPALAGASDAEYSIATTCGTSLAPNASCTVTVSFLPTVEGVATASLTFRDDDPSSPQVVPITGIGGLDFTLTGTTSESVERGNSITFTVTVTPVDNSTQTVNLTCTGAPADTTCTLSPSSITLDGVDAVTSTVTVTAGSLVPPSSRQRRFPGDFIGRVPLLVLGLSMLAIFALMRRRRALRLSFAAAALACLLFAGCGGGSGGSPTGKFTLVITGTPTDGGMVHTLDVALSID